MVHTMRLICSTETTEGSASRSGAVSAASVAPPAAEASTAVAISSLQTLCSKNAKRILMSTKPQRIYVDEVGVELVLEHFHYRF